MSALMALALVRRLPAYRRRPCAPTTWALAFSWAAPARARLRSQDAGHVHA
jgi:hypothetical protein